MCDGTSRGLGVGERGFSGGVLGGFGWFWVVLGGFGWFWVVLGLRLRKEVIGD
jgi:hypothetical protein